MPDASPPSQQLTAEHRLLEKDVGTWDARVVIMNVTYTRRSMDA